MCRKLQQQIKGILQLCFQSSFKELFSQGNLRPDHTDCSSCVPDSYLAQPPMRCDSQCKDPAL